MGNNKREAAGKRLWSERKRRMKAAGGAAGGIKPEDLKGPERETRVMFGNISLEPPLHEHLSS